MINILYLVSSLARVGPTNQLLGLIRGVDRSKYNVHLLTLSAEGTDSLWHLFEKEDIKLSSLGFGRLKGLLFNKAKVDKYISDNRIDIVHTSGIRADKIGVTLGRNKVIHISSLRNFPREDYLVKFGGLKGFLMANQHEKIIKKMNHPVACSKSLSKKLNALNPKVIFVQNGVDVSRFPRPKENSDIKELRQKLGLSETKKILIFCGSLIQRKRPVELLEVFREVDNEDWHLVYLGDGPLLSELNAVKTSNITFVGKVSNPEEFYQASDVFVSGSDSEGLPNSVLEAMSTGLFSILSDIGPHIEILADRSDCGALFKLNDKKSFCKELEKTLNSYNKDKVSISNYINDNFSSRKMSLNYQQLYGELLNE